jgi:hypothetical protein
LLTTGLSTRAFRDGAAERFPPTSLNVLNIIQRLRIIRERGRVIRSSIHSFIHSLLLITITTSFAAGLEEFYLLLLENFRPSSNLHKFLWKDVKKRILMKDLSFGD